MTAVKQQHTPGPWAVRGADSVFPDQTNITTDEGDFYVAAAFHMGIEGEREANARLIAAAPDLLAALLFVSEHSYAGGKSFADIPIVRDALAKARGEQP